MRKDFILRCTSALPHSVYLNGIMRRGLRAVFHSDVTKARRFSKDDILQHRKEHPHITGRFVRRDAEFKLITKAAKKTVAPTGTPP